MGQELLDLDGLEEYQEKLKSDFGKVVQNYYDWEVDTKERFLGSLLDTEE